MGSSFVHLHVHTLYSFLDGAIKVGPLVSRVAELGMPAVAMTDHGNMFGAVEFFTKCKAKGIKPIIGSEFNLVSESAAEHKGDPFHLTALALNDQGYRNLMRLSSDSWLQGMHRGVPYIDPSMLESYHQGLVLLSGDLGGEIPRAILRNDMDKAREIAGYYRELVGPERFYLEMMDNDFPEQAAVNRGLLELSKSLELEIVATNDAHYMEREIAAAQGILMCIQLGKSVELEQATSHGVDSFYLKTPEEMRAAFAELPQACDNTLKIAEMVDFEMSLGEVYLPQYKVPESFIAEIGGEVSPKEAIHEYFKERARSGLEDRLNQLKAQGLEIDEAVYRERLEIEIGIITNMDFPGYFLIVWDFINWSKRQGIPVGPGRGSGAGSLVAYSLTITDIDPMQYGLLFERFLNPERVSMPDFDIDFCMNRRGEVIDYVTEAYGKNNVGQIATFGGLKARACIRDVGRALAFSFSETDRIAKLIPDEIGITLQQAKDKEPKLRALLAEDERVDQLYTIGMQLEGLYRQAGMHAAGIVISETPLWDFVPVFRGANDEIVTQYAKNEVEMAGLVKFDFLGLKTLTVLDEARKLIDQGQQERGEAGFDLAAIPMDDPEVFRLISEGRTTGVFQLESSGFKELLGRLKPDCFEDIVAAVALYRPGPLGSGMVDQFVECKHGLREVTYLHPWLEGILKETYGVIVYQEQVMQSAQILAGYSLGDADIMRRAMGKKKPEEMAKQRGIFVNGALKNGVDGDQAGEIFDLIEKFAGYGFNKSHSAAYALISYQTAYLKTHYPVEFTAATLTCDKENTTKVVRTIADARANGIQVLPPDVNASILDFGVSEQQVRFGLGGIKGVGSNAIESIVEARKEGPYKGLFDFCERVDLKRVNRRVLEALVKCGAFDSTWKAPLEDMKAVGDARARLYAAISNAIDRGQKTQSEQAAGQSSLFNLFAAATPGMQADTIDSYPEAEPWSDRVLLRMEKETLGFYVTGHPLDRYAEELDLYASASTLSITQLSQNAEVTLAGVLADKPRERPVKRGEGRMAFLQVEDKYGQLEVICFARCYGEYEEVIKSDEPLLVRGKVSIEGDGASQVHRIKAEEVRLLANARSEMVGHVLFESEVGPETLQALDQLSATMQAHEGDCQSYLRLRFPAKGQATLPLPGGFTVAATDELKGAVEALPGKWRVQFGLK